MTEGVHEGVGDCVEEGLVVVLGVVVAEGEALPEAVAVEEGVRLGLDEALGLGEGELDGLAVGELEQVEVVAGCCWSGLALGRRYYQTVDAKRVANLRFWGAITWLFPSGPQHGGCI